MEIRELRSLAMLEELGSIAQVANAVNLSAAAIHKQLKSLESELQVRLYERQGRRLKLTQPAEVILPHIKELLAQYDAATTALDEWKGMKKGLVRIGAGPSISAHLLPPMLKQFRNRYPDVDVLVETGGSRLLTEKLEKGDLDLAMVVASDPVEEPRVTVEASWEHEIVLVSTLPEAPKRCSIRDLAKFPFLLFQKGGRVESLIDRYMAGVGLRPRVVMRFDNAEAIRAMIRTGLGVSMLPMWTVEDDLRAGTVSVIRQREKRLSILVILISSKLRYLPRTVLAFSELARESGNKLRADRR